MYGMEWIPVFCSLGRVKSCHRFQSTTESFSTENRRRRRERVDRNDIMAGGGDFRRTDAWLALSHLRLDGRQPLEVRRLQAELGVVPGRVGSALVRMGLTSCVAVVTGPMECARRSEEHADRALLEVTLQLAPLATPERRGGNAASDRRLLEGGQQIQKALEATVLLQTYPRTRIAIHIVVLSDDGGRISAALNSATLALIDAGVALKDFCCACSAGVASTSSTVLVDLNRGEEQSDTGLATVAILPQRDGIMVLAQCSAARLSDFDSLERLLEAAAEGCRAVFTEMQAAVQCRAVKVLSAPSVGAGDH
jgi:exosome complex component RRP41